EWMQPGEAKTLIDVQTTGIIQRIWLTVSQDKNLSRDLRLQMWWDHDNKPAVDVPLIDFFGFHVDKRVSYESAMISSPEGRSYNCYIPMPFLKAAKIVLTNESSTNTYKLFFDVDFIEVKKLPANSNYFHAYWTRQKTSSLGKDFLVLPEISGQGRYLGMSVGVTTDTIYKETWWGEGEVKMYLDNDKEFPTIAGTGAEDYVGTGWGMGTYNHQYQGCTVADPKEGKFSFYRWHIPDAIYFEKNLKITLQQIGGGPKEVVKNLFNNKVKLLPVTIDAESGFVRLLDLEKPITINNEDFINGWVNFYRVDDYVAVSYFYLNKTSSHLPGLPTIENR
ncbi:MAG: glycoside hydrolase family 172 protein, partial [Chitinophagaceae bacterium]